MREKMVWAKARQIISDIMESYTNAKGKKMWCEKSPSNLIYLDILKGVFPDSKFICLYRHCMDVAHSLIEYSRYGLMEAMVPYVHRNPNSIINATVEYWIEQTRKTLNFERENASQCFRVKYESIILETSQTLDGLFTFLGIKWDPKMLEAIFTTRHDPGHGDTKVLFTKNIEVSNIGKGTALPRALVSPRLLEEANLLLEELGYMLIGAK
jgi:protein-tyrosine sulfotransferase